MGITIPKEIEELESLYGVDDQAVEFLAANSHLIPFLHELAPVLHRYFPGAPLRLHLERDPETGREIELRALAGWAEAKDWRDAVDRLDRFRRDWWFDHSRPVRRWLAVSFEFLGPEQ